MHKERKSIASVLTWSAIYFVFILSRFKSIQQLSMKLHNVLIISTILAILLSISVPAKSQEVDNEKEFSYVPGSKNGPERWGEIKEEWAICGKGKMQSPIDLTYKRVQVVHDLGELIRVYWPANAVIKNRGHDIMLEWKEQAGGILIHGKKYHLRQMHWHSPSEHLINGSRYCLEMHMVHESADKKIAVVGVIYEIGQPDSFLAKMEHHIRKLEHGENEVKVGIVDPTEVKWEGRQYYRYMGSLTTPPCTEGVIWTIIKKVRTVSRAQVKMLRDAVHDGFENNARPIQKINDRVISLYLPREYLEDS